jgi:hypothetical protein
MVLNTSLASPVYYVAKGTQRSLIPCGFVKEKKKRKQKVRKYETLIVMKVCVPVYATLQ